MRRLLGVANMSAYTLRQYIERFISNLPEEKQGKIKTHF